MNLYLGIDLGTTGVRTAVIDENGDWVSDAMVAMPSPVRVNNRPCQDANLWWQATKECLIAQSKRLVKIGRQFNEIDAFSVDGTSGTLLLADTDLKPLTLGYMYNSGEYNEEAERIAAHAPDASIARGAGSSLARLMFLQKQVIGAHAKFALHQADWIAAKLMRFGGMSDETNVLKMGFDVVHRRWPDWISKCTDVELLPDVRPVGDTFGQVCQQVAEDFGFPPDARVVAGATDSNAAFLASGASQIGEGVTSLGTTLVIKLLSAAPVSDPSRGIYSHRIKDMWLPGGASNSGGGVLLDYFTLQQMVEMETELEVTRPTELDYYPLSRPGERFPIADPSLQPRLTPRPASDTTFFQGILEGIGEIERMGYLDLAELGAPQLRKVYTAGGGAKNNVWTKIRSAKLGVPVVKADSSEAAVGTARIAAGLI